MAHIYRLIFILSFVFLSSSVFALSPVLSSWTGSVTSGTFSNASQCLSAQKAVWNSRYPAYSGCATWSDSISGNTAISVLGGCAGGGASCTASTSQCPENSSSSGSSCTCNAGFEEKDGACSPKCESGSTYNNLTGYCQPHTPDDDTPKGPCDSLKNTPLGLSDYGASFGTKSADWMKNQIGKPANSCFPGGCVVSGEATGCAGGGSGSTYCKIANPTFTGASCSESDNPGDDDNCQPGYKASEYVPGVCIPDGSDGTGDGTGDGGTDDDDSDGLCPDKTDPTKRVPCQGKPSKCSGGLCESKYVPGLCVPCDTSVNGDGTTTCNPTTGKCTTTNPDGTTDEQDKTDFCRENPKSPMCIENKWGGGSCASGSFSCDGDAIQCAIAKEQHRRNCKLFDDKSAETALYEQEKGKEGNQTDDLPGNETINVLGRIDSTDALGGGGAGAKDLTVTVAGSSITLPFSKINPGLDALGRVLLAVSFLIALRIIGRG